MRPSLRLAATGLRQALVPRARGCRRCGPARRRRCARDRPGTAARRSASTTSSELQEFPDRVGRVAVVEVQRDAPEQVVAGDQQAPLGLEQAHVRGGVAGGLVGALQSPRSVSIRHPRRGASRSGSIDRRDAAPCGSALGGVAAQRLLRHAALARDLQPPRERAPRGLRPCGACARGWGASTARSPALHDRRRLAVVIGVGVGADHQAHVLKAQVAHRQRPLEVRQRARLVHAGVEQHEPRRRPPPPRRCSGERPARAAAGAVGRRPGSTRSPRPSSRLTSDLHIGRLGHRAETRLSVLQPRG